MKYIDAEKLIKAINDKGLDCSFALKMERLDTLALIDELQQERGPHTESWIEDTKKELQHEEELLEMRLDTLKRIREKKNQFKQEQPEVDLEKELQAFLCNYDYEFDDDAPACDIARHFYELGLNARKEK